MFNNTGEKLKNFAYVIFVLCFLGSIVGGFIIMINPISVAGMMQGEVTTYAVIQVIKGISTIIFGVLSSYAVALIVYGLGVIVKNAEKVDSSQICETCGKTSNRLIDCEVRNGKRWIRKNICENCYVKYVSEGSEEK